MCVCVVSFAQLFTLNVLFDLAQKKRLLKEKKRYEEKKLKLVKRIWKRARESEHFRLLVYDGSSE